jgi:hypothetical protein
MRTVPQLTVKEFANWYADQFSTGDLNPDNFSESAHYLSGLRDAFLLVGNQDLSTLDRAIECMRGAANLVNKIEYLSNHKLTDLEYQEMLKSVGNRIDND